jgi:hypothetical protein
MTFLWFFFADEDIIECSKAGEKERDDRLRNHPFRSQSTIL